MMLVVHFLSFCILASSQPAFGPALTSLCGCKLQASGKQASFFNKPLRSPASFDDVEVVAALTEGVAPLAIGSPPANSLEQA